MKWAGKIGFYVSVKKKPGIWEDSILERDYIGELLRNAKRDKSDSSINDDFTINNQIRVLCDPFLIEHHYAMRYITFLDAKYKISSVDFNWPAMTFELGGLFNEEDKEEDDGGAG